MNFGQKIKFSAPELAGRSEREVIDLILQAAISETPDPENPFSGESKSWCIWRDLAQWCLDPDVEVDISQEWIPIENFVKRSFQGTPMRILPVTASCESVGYVFHAFFDDIADDLAYSWGRIYDFAADGIPMYRKLEGVFKKLPDTDPDYIFFRQMGLHLMRTRDGCFPSWAKDIFVRGEHVKAHSLFMVGDFDEKDKPTLLRALHAHIGISVQTSQPADNGAQSSLLDIALRCRNNFWTGAANHNKQPKAKEITDWLMDEYGLSGRQAQAIELVVRPRTT